MLEVILFSIAIFATSLLLFFVVIDAYWQRRNAEAAEELRRALKWADRKKLMAHEEYAEMLSQNK